MRKLKPITWWNKCGPSNFEEVYCLHNALTHGYHTWKMYDIKYDEDRDEYLLSCGAFGTWLDGAARMEMLMQLQQDHGLEDSDVDAYFEREHAAHKAAKGDTYQPVTKPVGVPNDLDDD